MKTSKSLNLYLFGLILIAGVVKLAESRPEINIQPESDDTGRVDVFPDAVYVIRNRQNDAVLTTANNFESNGELKATAQSYNNLPGQKWRLQKSTFGSSFRIAPTSNEMANLDLGSLGFWGSFVSFGNQKYWTFKGMGEGVVEIQNYLKPELCITSNGLGKSIEVQPCMNHANQQWILQKI